MTAKAGLGTGDSAGAVAVVKTILAREPKNEQAWGFVGSAHLQAKNYDEARAACARSLELKPDSPVAFYNIGVTYALQDKKEDAFHWLLKAKKTRKVDMTQAQEDKDLANLKDDPRFSALMPSRDDFAHPFVEDVKILHEWLGDSKGWCCV